MNRGQSNKLDFKGQNIYVGIDAHLKSWSVAVLSQHSVLKKFRQDPSGYSGDMHSLIPVKCTHLLNYQFDKVILFFLNCLLLTRFYALCELPCL